MNDIDVNYLFGLLETISKRLKALIILLGILIMFLLLNIIKQTSTGIQASEIIKIIPVDIVKVAGRYLPYGESLTGK